KTVHKKGKGGIRKDLAKSAPNLYKASPFSFFPPYFPAPTTPERSDSGLRHFKKNSHSSS
ncbi:TPA: hypothetical protein ACOB3C_002111, partial [Neisseria gonorrhoeae]